MRFLVPAILFFIYYAPASAQTLHLQGTIVDLLSNKPIAGATISFPKANLFFPADNNGVFKLNSEQIKNADTLLISCIGYQTKKIIAEALKQDQMVKLSPVSVQLSEVKIAIRGVVNVGSKLKSGNAGITISPNNEIAMFMAGSAHVKGLIQSVGFYLGNGSLLTAGKGDVTAPFRIKLYSVGEKGEPGKELINDVVVVSAKTNNTWFDINLSRYQIRNPENGFFATFVLLDKSYYEMNEKYMDPNKGLPISSAYIATPRLATTYTEFTANPSFHGLETRWGFEWRENAKFFGANYSYLIRATINPE